MQSKCSKAEKPSSESAKPRQQNPVLEYDHTLSLFCEKVHLSDAAITYAHTITPGILSSFIWEKAGGIYFQLKGIRILPAYSTG